jgi:hypothetical protein
MEWFGIVLLVLGGVQVLAGVSVSKLHIVYKSEDPGDFWMCVATWCAVGAGAILFAY